MMKISANKIHDGGKTGHCTLELTLVRYFSSSLQMLIDVHESMYRDTTMKITNMMHYID
jgi:hypothetical protein